MWSLPSPATSPDAQVSSGMPLIVLQDISKVYQSGEVRIHALSGIEITIEKGEFVAIVVQSGSGKTTLLDILGCLGRPTEGGYWLDGQNVGLLSDEERRAHQAFIGEMENALWK